MPAVSQVEALTSQILMNNLTALESLRREIVQLDLQGSEEDVRKVLPRFGAVNAAAQRGVEVLAGYDHKVDYAGLVEIIAHFTRGMTGRQTAALMGEYSGQATTGG